MRLLRKLALVLVLLFRNEFDEADDVDEVESDGDEVVRDGELNNELLLFVILTLVAPSFRLDELTGKLIFDLVGFGWPGLLALSSLVGVLASRDEVDRGGGKRELVARDLCDRFDGDVEFDEEEEDEHEEDIDDDDELACFLTTRRLLL